MGEGHVNSALVIDAPPPNAAPTTAEADAGSAWILGQLLKMADSYRLGNHPRQAEQMYFDLLDEHAESLAARVARSRLLEMGVQYEQNGEFHHARAIYERLLG